MKNTITIRSWKLVAIALAVLMTTVPVMGQQAEESPVQDTFTVEPDTLMVTVSATGIVEPVRAVSLVFEASAPVTAINFQEGDTVEAGDILATLDADDLEAALREAEIALELQQLSFEALIAPPREVDIAAAEAAVAAAEAGVPAAGQGSTREQIEIARLNAELARNQLWQSQLQRDQIFDTRPEFRPGATTVFGSQSGVESAEFGVGIADANVQATIQAGGGLGAIASAEAALVRSQVALDELLRGPDQVDILRFEIQLDQSELAVEQARVALERAQLEAPFGGVVSQNNLSLGELPPATQPAIELIDNSSYFIDLAIDETDVVNVQLGQEVSLRLDALGETQLTGAITRLSVLPDANNTVVVYRARVTLDPTEAPIRVGMSTTATITTSELEDVLVVPNRFIRPDPDDANAFFVTIQSGENQFQEIPVQVGERNNEVTQILSGVEPGQVIVQVRRDAPGVEVLFGN